jgi:protein ImuB
MMMKYAVLLAPEFRLQATLRHLPDLAGQPVVLLENRGTKTRVVELNAKARSFQVERGMTPTQALARCAELHLLNGNPGHERSAQDALLQTAEVLSPFLESTGLGVITVQLPPEISFSEAELIQKCVSPLIALGVEIRLGVAHSPDLALLAARFGDPIRMVESSATFLAPLPIEALQPSDELSSILNSWGIRTIGQMVNLPMAQVCERLGPEAVEFWERSQGGRPRPLKLARPQEFFAEQADLENPVEMLEPLLFLLRRFLEQIGKRLGTAYLVAGKLRLVLRFEKGPPYQRIFTIPEPTREVDLLFRMLHTHLENFISEFPIIGLELAAKPVRPTAEQFSLLEKGLRDPHQFSETLGRMQALLGSDRVGSPEVELSHHPDAFHIQPYENDTTSPSGTDDDLLVGVPWLRFRPPIQARIILHGARPAYLYSSRCTGPIKDARGPWLLDGNWWDEKQWEREEWDVATDEGLYRLVHVDEGWFLDGIYA